MSERDFFSDTVTEDEEDDFLRDALDDGNSEPADDIPGDDDDLTDDSETDEEEDLEDSEEEEDDLDDEDLDDGEDEDELPSPSADFDGWLETLEDDERSVVENLVAQASESEQRMERLTQVSQTALFEIQKRDIVLRQMEQRLKIALLAAQDPHKFMDFQQEFKRAQEQYLRQQNSPERQQLDQVRNEMRTFIASTIEREQREGLLDHVRSGKPLTMDDGSKIAFKQLSPVEDQLLANARTPQEFDNAVLQIQAARQQSTQRARDALRTQRTSKGSDRAGVRASGGHGGTKSNYGNYHPDNFDAYMDDVMSGASRG